MAHAPRPLLGLAACLGAGAWIGSELPFEAAPLVLGMAAVCLVLNLIGASGAFAVVGLGSVAMAIGAAGHAVEREGYDRSTLRRFVLAEGPESPAWISGTAASDSRRSQDRVQLIIDVDQVRWRGTLRRLAGRARIGVSDPWSRLEVSQGERIGLWTTLRPPRGSESPGAFDTVEDARRRGSHVQGYCKSVSLVSRIGPAAPAGLVARVSGWRRSARLALGSALPRGDEEGLVRAMVLGDRAGLSSDASEAFRIAGTYHVLALSGAQVALVAGLLLLLLKRLRVAPFPSALLVAAGVALYAVFVGADAPVARAALMAVCLALGRALDLDADGANLLGAAGGVLLVHQPSAIGDLSFQLSFAATLGILLLARPVAGALPSLPFQAQLMIAVSIAAQAALLPLLALSFHRLAPAAILLNLVAGPLSAAVLASGFCLLLASALTPGFCGVVAEVTWALAHALLRSSDAARAFPWLDVRVPTPSPLAIAIYLLALMLLWRGSRRAGAGALLAALAWFLLGPGAPADGRLWLSVLDVGHGDALVLRSPSGRVLLVDAGPATRGFDAGEAVVAPFLWSLGIRRADRMLLTHADGDHVGGAVFLSRAFSVRELWEGIAPLRDPRYRRLERDVAGQMRRIAVRPGGVLAWDGVTLEILGPARLGPPPRLSRNEHSVVVRVRYRAVSLLLLGDAQREAESGLSLHPAHVIKIAHHGSRTGTSSELLERVRPRVALVSVASSSPFGHPHEEVLRRLWQAGAHTLRTDRDGTLSVATDGLRVWFGGHAGGAASRLQTR